MLGLVVHAYFDISMQLRVRTCGAGSSAKELVLDVDDSVQELRVADIKRLISDKQPLPKTAREDEAEEEESFVLFRGRILMDADVIALHSLVASDFLVIASDQSEDKPPSGSTELLLAAVPAQYCAALLDLPQLAAIDPFHALMHVKDSLPTSLLLELNENPVSMLQLLTTPPVAATGSEPVHGGGDEAEPVDLTETDAANVWTQHDDAAVGRVSSHCSYYCLVQKEIDSKRVYVAAHQPGLCCGPRGRHVRVLRPERTDHWQCAAGYALVRDTDQSRRKNRRSIYPLLVSLTAFQSTEPD